MPLEMDELSIYRTPYSTFGDWISTPLVGQPLADSPNSIKQSDKPSLRKQLLLRFSKDATTILHSSTDK